MRYAVVSRLVVGDGLLAELGTDLRSGAVEACYSRDDMMSHDASTVGFDPSRPRDPKPSSSHIHVLSTAQSRDCVAW